MRIAFLCQRFLLQMDTDGKLRTGKIFEQLRKNHGTSWFGNYDPKKAAEYRDQVGRFCQRIVPLKWDEPRRHNLRFYKHLEKNQCSTYPTSGTCVGA